MLWQGLAARRKTWGVSLVLKNRSQLDLKLQLPSFLAARKTGLWALSAVSWLALMGSNFRERNEIIMRSRDRRCAALSLNSKQAVFRNVMYLNEKKRFGSV